MFSRLFRLATTASQRALGCRSRTLALGEWRVRLHRGGRPGAEPWVLLHGLGATSATFLPLERHLRASAELWLPELSELGGTRGPRPALDVPAGVDLVGRLLDAELPGARPTICGISLGGWMAARFAAAHPERVGRLLLVVPGGYRDQDWERIAELVRVETYADTEALWRALFVAPPWWLRLARYGFFLAYTSRAVGAVLSAVREEDAFGDADLARLDLPVGLIWGARDHLFRVEVGERMLAALPRGRLWTIAEGAHAVQWERQEEFLAAVDAFRTACPLPDATLPAQDRISGTPSRR